MHQVWPPSRYFFLISSYSASERQPVSSAVLALYNTPISTKLSAVSPTWVSTTTDGAPTGTDGAPSQADAARGRRRCDGDDKGVWGLADTQTQACPVMPGTLATWWVGCVISFSRWCDDVRGMVTFEVQSELKWTWQKFSQWCQLLCHHLRLRRCFLHKANQLFHAFQSQDGIHVV